MPLVVTAVVGPHDRGGETMPGPVALRLGDRTLWLVPRASLVPAFSRAASDVLGGAIAAWPGAFALLDLSDAGFGPCDDVADVHRFATAEVEAERWLVARLDDGARDRPITQGDGAVRWDDLPRLSDLRPTLPDRPRGGGGGRRTAPTSPMDDGPPDDTRRDDPATTFVAFAVVDQHGVPLRGAWSCPPRGRGSLAGETVQLSGLPLDTASIALALTDLRRDAADHAAGSE